MFWELKYVTKTMDRVVVDAFFTSKQQNGEQVCLVRKNDNWEWRPARSIANLDSFTTTLNPLTCLLNQDHSGKFNINQINPDESTPLFDFGDNGEKVFVINPLTQNSVAVPLSTDSTQPPKEQNKITSLEELYQMAEKIAVDEK